MDISQINLKKYLCFSVNKKIDIIKYYLHNKINDYEIKIKNNIPILTHKNYKIDFTFIPPGNYNMGFSKSNQKYAEKISPIVNANYNEMRPLKKCYVDKLLVQITPFCDENYKPVFVSFNEALEISQKYNMRIIKEHEWEYCARAGTSTLFPFGNTLPNETDLNKWMNFEFNDLNNCLCNGLGLYGLFTGEWTDSMFNETNHVIRGGGAYFWPWQSEEWVMCMSAMRAPESDLIDGTCSFRLICDID